MDYGTSTLNLGCGDDYRGDAWNVDIESAVDPDQVVDIRETPWPWPNNEWSTVIASHVFEHLETIPWAELERVVEPGGTLELTYPIGHTRFEDPTHAHYWNVNTAWWLAGEGKHGHERPVDLALLRYDIKWDLNPPSTVLELWTRWHLFWHGAGPWLDQVPGLYGEVTATYAFNHE